MSITFIMHRERTTPGTIVFSNKKVGEALPSKGVAIKTLYIAKGQGFDDVESVTVTVEAR